jgi:hypothetical protein
MSLLYLICVISLSPAGVESDYYNILAMFFVNDSQHMAGIKTLLAINLP